jgi:maltose-binding protein MalE
MIRGSMLVIAVVALLAMVSGCTTSSSKDSSGVSTSAGVSLTVSEPQDNTITDTPTIDVSGHTNPEAVVSVNDVVTTADANGNFTTTISLNEGPNTIEVVASDQEGNQASVTLIVTLVKGG